MLTFKEAYYMGKHRSAAWHADGGANDEGHEHSRMREVHKVYINGRHWKTFGSHGEAKRAHDAVKNKHPDKSVSMHRTYMESIDMCNVCGQTPCNCTHIEEETKWKVSYDVHGSNKDVPLYSNHHHVRAKSGEEAISIVKKLVGGTKHKAELVKEEQIDELSSELLDRYKKKAGLAAQAADKAKKYDLGHKRFKGIIKATFKQFANDAKK